MSSEAKIVDMPQEGMPSDMPEMRGRKPTPNQQKYMNLVKQLTDTAANLVVKVATCKCKEKDRCNLFIQAQKIAIVIEQLQDARTEEMGEAKPVGARRGRARA